MTEESVEMKRMGPFVRLEDEERGKLESSSDSEVEMTPTPPSEPKAEKFGLDSKEFKDSELSWFQSTCIVDAVLNGVFLFWFVFALVALFDHRGWKWATQDYSDIPKAGYGLLGVIVTVNLILTIVGSCLMPSSRKRIIAREVLLIVKIGVAALGIVASSYTLMIAYIFWRP